MPMALLDDERWMTELDAAALLAHAAVLETLPRLAERVHVREDRLLDMIEGKEHMPRRVVRYLGLRRELRYYRVN